MRRELSQYFNINKVFILGAGFSFPAGLPLTYELLQLIHLKSQEKDFYDEEHIRYKYGQAELLLQKLNYYYPLKNLTHEQIENGKINDIDVEQFLSFAAAESAFLHPSDKLTSEGSRFISFAKQWLAEVIYEKQILALKKLPRYYKSFIKNLENSLILTFNWDTLLETLFEEENINYRHQLNSKDYDSRNKSIPLLKLHGSIDWVAKRELDYKEPDWTKFVELDKGFNKLRKIKGDLTKYYRNFYYPSIVLPNFDKLNQLTRYGELWESPWRYLNDKLEIIFIGFSFRKDDFHTRAFMYPKIVAGSRRNELSIKVIDFADSQEKKCEIEKRFEGIENCRFWFEGFKENSLNFIFENEPL